MDQAELTVETTDVSTLDHMSERGFIAGPILWMVGLMTLLTTVLGGSFLSMMTTSRTVVMDTSARDKINLVMRAIAAESVLTGTAYTMPTPAALPAGDARVPANAAVTGAGIIPSTSGSPKSDPWGRYILYCAWNQSGNIESIKTNIAYAVIIAGPDGTAQTTCAQAASDTPQGDDVVMQASVASALNYASAFSMVNPAAVQFGGNFPSQAMVGIGTSTPGETLDVAGDARVSGQLTVGGSISAGSMVLTTPLDIGYGGTGARTAPAARTNLGLGTIATQDASNVMVTGGAIDGTTVGGTTAATGNFTTLSASAGVSVSGGAISAPLGSAGTPSYTFGGDTDTGLYSPGPNIMAVTTGGTERLRVGAAGVGTSGNLGIGTASPAAQLSVTGAGQPALSGAGNTYGMYLYHDTAAGIG